MIDHILTYTIPAAYSLLPPAMRSIEATALLLAIGLQESRFLHRRQTEGGPARGFWQFEANGGVQGVLAHTTTQETILDVLTTLRYPIDAPVTIYHAVLEHHDVLACCFARLLLWTLPGVLPARGEVDRGWTQYLDAWRPGRPHSETWPALFEEAWTRVDRSVQATPIS